MQRPSNLKTDAYILSKSSPMRPVLFVFYMVEIVLHLLQVYFHLVGFLKDSLGFLPVSTQVNHYLYSVSFYVFTTVSFFASINICTGNRFVICEEILRTVIGFLVHTLISLMTLHNAECDFHIMYSSELESSELNEPMHPYFQFLIGQALISLVVAVVYLLHGILITDVYFSCGGQVHQENNCSAEQDKNYVPIKLYVLGGWVHCYLSKYTWFDDFSKPDTIYI